MTNTQSSLFHQCKVCRDLAESLPPLSTAVSEGAASGLQAAKDQVKTNLQGEQLGALTESLEQLGKQLGTELLNDGLMKKDGPFANNTLLSTVS